jgi:hypothetical protein
MTSRMMDMVRYCSNTAALLCFFHLFGSYVWNSDMKLLKEMKRLYTEVFAEYPFVIKSLKYFHTGTAMNVLIAMLKSVIAEPLKSNIETGCVFEDRLDKIYLVPTLEEANQRFMHRVTQTLQRRYDQERTFRL